MIEILLKCLASYLLGSLMGSLVVGQLRGGVDIRKLGSGNAGGTNALRTQGKRFAVWVVLIDIGKGFIATRVIASLTLPALIPVSHEWLPVLCGLAAMLGHIHPIWYGFRGGKGAATLVGGLLGIDAWLLVPMLVTWLGTVVLSGYVGLASMAAAASLPIFVAATAYDPREPLLVFGWVATALIVFTHRSNIARMRAGIEPRAQRLWLLGLSRQ